MEKEELIPTQQIGRQTDAVEEKIFSTAIEAKTAYQQAANRLLDVNKWQRNSTITASSFALFDSDGSPIERLVQQGDYIRIDIPGPGTSAGNGYDWVCIENMEQFSDEESGIEFTLLVARPSKNPGECDDKIAHFFTNQATSTFFVFRRASVLSVEVHGRNELPNTQDQNLLDKVRNLVVNGGSAIGMSFTQWHLLISGILNGAG